MACGAEGFENHNAGSEDGVHAIRTRHKAPSWAQAGQNSEEAPNALLSSQSFKFEELGSSHFDLDLRYQSEIMRHP